jgi:hypothetical protein
LYTIYLNEKDLGFPCQREALVALERLQEDIDFHHFVDPPHKAFLSMRQNGTGEAIAVTVVRISRYNKLQGNIKQPGAYVITESAATTN